MPPYQVGADPVEPRTNINSVGAIVPALPECDQEGVAEQVVCQFAYPTAEVVVNGWSMPVEDLSEHLWTV